MNLNLPTLYYSEKIGSRVIAINEAINVYLLKIMEFAKCCGCLENIVCRGVILNITVSGSFINLHMNVHKICNGIKNTLISNSILKNNERKHIPHSENIRDLSGSSDLTFPDRNFSILASVIEPFRISVSLDTSPTYVPSDIPGIGLSGLLLKSMQLLKYV